MRTALHRPRSMLGLVVRGGAGRGGAAVSAPPDRAPRAASTGYPGGPPRRRGAQDGCLARSTFLRAPRASSAGRGACGASRGPTGPYRDLPARSPVTAAPGQSAGPPGLIGAGGGTGRCPSRSRRGARPVLGFPQHAALLSLRGALTPQGNPHAEQRGLSAHRTAGSNVHPVPFLWLPTSSQHSVKRGTGAALPPKMQRSWGEQPDLRRGQILSSIAVSAVKQERGSSFTEEPKPRTFPNAIAFHFAKKWVARV
ncbi:uncharacterized protein LOC110403821 [Numida meleagris]|uniref:uncharacterized protein LOC110403821 n=1 Tax=Numida meleagris TaxID=8996 RepID=UPI000B3E0180|nr:uncharacterized protein LOC110403821 [Numida meleagris]